MKAVEIRMRFIVKGQQKVLGLPEELIGLLLDHANCWFS